MDGVDHINSESKRILEETTENASLNISEKIHVEATTEHESTESCEVSNTDVDASKDENQWEDLLGSGSLMKLIITRGKEGTRPQRLENCKLKFVCTLEDGTVVEEQDVFEMQLGDSEVVQGLDLAIGLMNVGEICKLKIESRLAYGRKGLHSTVPPDTPVHYTIELLSVQPEDEPETLSVNERQIKGNKKRSYGNWWYSRGENQIAIQCYRRALDYLDEVEGGIKTPLSDGEEEITDSALQQLLEDRINVSNNMAAAQLKLELYDAAMQSLQTVLQCQPENVKALFRKAKVYQAKNDVNAALSYLKKAEKASPDNADVLKEIANLQRLQEKQKKSEKELARRMFNGLNNDSKPQKSNSSSKLFMWATVGASIAIGLVGITAYRFKFL